jgi:hypothetical protein
MNINFFGIDSITFGKLELINIAFGIIIFFIILYLVRPKSVKKMIPSLMFLILNKKKGKFNSFLQKILIEPLYLFQFLILLLLLLTMLMPFVSYQYDQSNENTIFVLDVSASMNADEKIEEMKKIVKENIVGTTSVILIKKNPHIYFEDKNPKEAIELIELIKPTASTTNIIEAIRLADEKMQNKTGRIIVISDFKDTENSYKDLINIKYFIESKNKIIEYHVLKPKTNNIGFIDSNFLNNEITLHIKNYNNKNKNITIELNNNIKKIEIMPNSIEIIKLNLEKGKHIIKILEKDEFMLDNEYYINIPDNKKMNVLLVTNNKNTYLHDFLRSSPYIELKIIEPPLIPTLEHDVIIFDNVKRQHMLNRIKDELIKYVFEGGSLVITRTGDLEQLNIDDLLPVEIDNKIIQKMQTNQYEKITKDLFFGTISFFKNANLKEGSAPILDGEFSTLIAYSNYEKGIVMYYGIPEENNDFKLTTSFPLFWNRVLNYITKFNDFDSLNVKSEEFGFEEQVGFIQQSTKTIAVNLLNEKESDIVADSKIISFIEETKFEKQSIFITLHWNLIYILIPLIILFLILELIFTKYRGDL